MFTIGQFSKICRVTTKTLRHYDEVNLLKPARVDPLTGYRYYSIEQIDEFRRIALLKELGFGLEAIEHLLKQPLDAAELAAVLKDQAEHIRQRVDEYQRVLARITQKAGRYANDYAIVPAEDGPAPVAEAVEIISLEGQKVARLTVPGAQVANFRWGADGNHLAFAAGKVKSSPAGQAGPRGEAAMEWQSLWVVDLQGKMTKVADLPPDATHIIPLNVTPDGKQALYAVSRYGCSSLWVVREGEKPVEVASVVNFWDDFFPAPGCADGFFLDRGEGGEGEIFRVQGDRATQITADGGQKMVLGVNGGRLAYIRDDRSGEESRLVVLSCVPGT